MGLGLRVQDLRLLFKAWFIFLSNLRVPGLGFGFRSGAQGLVCKAYELGSLVGVMVFNGESMAEGCSGLRVCSG